MANLEAYGEKVVGLTGSVVEWTQTQASGTKIAEIDIDGTTTDVYAPSGGGGGSVNYSTTEQVVGTWIDGKPLYQITVNTGQLPNNTTKNVAHGVSAIEKVVYFEGYVKRTDDAWFEPLPRIYVGNDAKAFLAIRVSTTNIILLTSSNLASVYNESFVTFRYTKTTD